MSGWDVYVVVMDCVGAYVAGGGMWWGVVGAA